MKKRKSNYELLRLVCLWSVVAIHYSTYLPEAQSKLLQSFVCFGVDTLLLISGFWGIKPTLRKFYMLFVECAFYGLIAYFIHILVSGQSIGFSIINNSILVFSNPPGWWFIKYYILLFLFSPVLNAASEMMPNRTLLSALALLFIVNVYFLWLYRDATFDSGFCLQHFIFIYLIGRFLNRFDLRKKGPSHLALCCLLCVWVCVSVLGFVFPNSYFLKLYHGNPITICISICIFFLFSNVSIHSAKLSMVINWIAASSLSIYLIHSNCYLSEYFGKWADKLITMPSLSILKLGMLIIVSVSLTICLPIVDKIRIFAMKPLDRAFDHAADICARKGLFLIAPKE